MRQLGQGSLWKDVRDLRVALGGAHFLTTPYTNSGFAATAFSDVASNTIIQNTSWSTAIPTEAKALLIRCWIRDSGSAGTSGLYLVLVGTAAGTIAAARIDLEGVPNDQWRGEQVIVPCVNGDVWYQVNASGAGTMDITLWCLGYWT